MTYRPLNLDSKREEYRKYLEKAGALDALSKVLVMLYDEPEKPADALEYIRKHLGDSNKPDETELGILKSELEASHLKIQALEEEVKVLKEKLGKDPNEESAAADDGEGGETSAAAEGGNDAEATQLAEDSASNAEKPAIDSSNQ